MPPVGEEVAEGTISGVADAAATVGNASDVGVAATGVGESTTVGRTVGRGVGCTVQAARRMVSSKTVRGNPLMINRFIYSPKSAI